MHDLIAPYTSQSTQTDCIKFKGVCFFVFKFLYRNKIKTWNLSQIQRVAIVKGSEHAIRLPVNDYVIRKISDSNSMPLWERKHINDISFRNTIRVYFMHELYWLDPFYKISIGFLNFPHETIICWPLDSMFLSCEIKLCFLLFMTIKIAYSQFCWSSCNHFHRVRCTIKSLKKTLWSHIKISIRKR